MRKVSTSRWLTCMTNRALGTKRSHLRIAASMAGNYPIIEAQERMMPFICSLALSNRFGANRARVRDYLAGVGDETEPYDGVTGSIAFAANGDVVDRHVVIGIVRNKRLESVAR